MTQDDLAPGFWPAIGSGDKPRRASFLPANAVSTHGCLEFGQEFSQMQRIADEHGALAGTGQRADAAFRSTLSPSSRPQ
jgi:hypothetical protein